MQGGVEINGVTPLNDEETQKVPRETIRPFKDQKTIRTRPLGPVANHVARSCNHIDFKRRPQDKSPIDGCLFRPSINRIVGGRGVFLFRFVLLSRRNILLLILTGTSVDVKTLITELLLFI